MYLTRNHQDCKGWFRFPYCQRKRETRNVPLTPYLETSFPSSTQWHLLVLRWTSTQPRARGVLYMGTTSCPDGCSHCILISLSQLKTLRPVMPSNRVRLFQCHCCQYHKLVPFFLQLRFRELQETSDSALSAEPASFHHGKDLPAYV